MNRSPRLTASLALAAFASTAIFALIVVILHVVQAGDDHPLRHAISELALGRAGWLMTIAFCSSGIGTLLLALTVGRGSTRPRVAPTLLAVAGLLAFVSAFVHADPSTSATTTHGTIHQVAGIATFILIIAAMFVLVRTFRREPSWRPLANPTRAWAFAALATLFLIPLGGSAYFGVAQRIFIATSLAWVLTISLCIHRAERQGDRSRAHSRTEARSRKPDRDSPPLTRPVRHMRGVVMKRSVSLVVAVSAVAGAAFAAATASATSTPASSSPPTISITMNRKSITVAGALVSGAVNIRSTVTAERLGEPTLVRLNPGVSYAQAFAGIGQTPDPNAVTPYGSIVFNTIAPRGTSNAQTTLQPGNYFALDTSAARPPFPVTTFTVTQASAPAALPPASATQTAIDFAFRGPTVLRDDTVVRVRNNGWLVHMIAAIGVPNAATGHAVMALLRAGKNRQAKRLETHASFTLALPISHGAVQQLVLKTNPGYYIEVCPMSTQDGRDHAQLGMLRLIRVVK